jgi:hypothetical protein
MAVAASDNKQHNKPTKLFILGAGASCEITVFNRNFPLGQWLLNNIRCVWSYSDISKAHLDKYQNEFTQQELDDKLQVYNPASKIDTSNHIKNIRRIANLEQFIEHEYTLLNTSETAKPFIPWAVKLLEKCNLRGRSEDKTLKYLANHLYIEGKKVLHDITSIPMLNHLVYRNQPTSIDAFIQDIDSFAQGLYQQLAVNKCFQDVFAEYKIFKDDLIRAAQLLVNILIPTIKLSDYEIKNSYFYYLLNKLAPKGDEQHAAYNLEIINFNYDLVLENVVAYMLANCTPDSARYRFLTEISDKVDSSHVYGKLGDWGEHIQFIRDDGKAYAHHKRSIQEAQDIYVLGFSFDDTNCRKIGLQNLDHSFNEAQRKNFYFTNYEGNVAIERKIHALFQQNLNDQKDKPNLHERGAVGNNEHQCYNYSGVYFVSYQGVKDALQNSFLG